MSMELKVTKDVVVSLSELFIPVHVIALNEAINVNVENGQVYISIRKPHIEEGFVWSHYILKDGILKGLDK